MIRLFVGFDQRESIAYHVFCQSVIEKASQPVAFIPITHKAFPKSDGSNSFTLSRYLIPYLCDYTGWAIYADSDMVMERDIAELWALRHAYICNTAVAVVKHVYHSAHKRKYIGTSMEADNQNYARKNWSSLVLWNCSHFGNRCLAPQFVSGKGGAYLHRFNWLEDKQIGELPPEWNHLVGEQECRDPKLRHYTLGIPAIKAYAGVESATWNSALLAALECPSEHPLSIVERAL